MKKFFALLLVAGAFTLTACGNQEAATEEAPAAPAADSTAMAPAPADSTAAPADSAAAPAAAAPAAH